jgi:hypothetical protein
MNVPRVSCSQELQDVVAQRGGLGAVDAAVVEAVSLLADRFAEVRLSPAWTAVEEGAEVSADGATLALTVLPGRFADPTRLTQFLRHELGHVADILDGAFGYGDTPEDLAITPALRRGCKLLWACSVDGRTVQFGGMPLHSSEEYEAEFMRRFPGLPRDIAGAAVKRLWHEERPCYCRLMRMAADLSVQPAAVPFAASQAAPGPRVRYAASMA